MKVFLTSGTFVATRDGKYKIRAQGAGNISGGAGGYGEKIVSLTKNQSVSITVSQSVSSFGSYIIANAGSGSEGGICTGADFSINGGRVSGGGSGAYNYARGNSFMGSGFLSSYNGETSPATGFGAGGETSDKTNSPGILIVEWIS